MSLLGNQTNITQKDFFFLLANVSTLTANNIQANNISTGNLIAGEAEISTINTFFVSTGFLEADSISSLNLEANYTEFSTAAILFGNISSIVTNNITLDGNTLDTGGLGVGSVLLLNGLPIATGTSSLSSIQDWSFFPALSTLKMDGNNISNAGNITCQNIFNALNVQTDTLSALTSATAPSAVITNLRTTNLSSINSVTSNATIGVSATAPLFSGTVGLFQGVSSLTVSTGTVNGQPFISGSNWSQYPATSDVNLQQFGLSNSSNLTITAARNIGLSNPSGGLTNWTTTVNTGDFTVLADQGLDITNAANLNLTAQGGSRGLVAITANAGGVNTLFGQVDITANGGSFGGIGTGGKVNITANTPLGFSNLTSALNLNAAGINMYAGAIPPLASVAGFNFIYGQGGVNICSGLPPLLPNTIGTTYIYGTLGIEMPSDAYMKNIYPYWDGLTTPPDLEITGRYIIPNLAQVNVRLSNVRYIYMEQGTQALIDGVGTMNMSNGTISNANNISGTGTISGYTNISGTNLGFTTATGTTVNSGTVNANSILGSNLISTSAMNLSSINGFASFGQQSVRVNGDVAQIQCRNNNPGGLGTNLNLLSRVAFSEVQSFNSNFTQALPLVLTASYTSTASMLVSSINGQAIPYAYGSFTANTTQIVTASNTATPVQFDTTEYSVGISLANVSSIQVDRTGLYRILASPQFDKSGGGTSLAYFWLTKNGIDVERTNSQMTIQGNNGEVFSSVEFLQYLSTGEEVGISFASPDNTMSVTAYPGTAFAPSTPAVIFNINQLAS
jgi:hypothetical protein